MLRDVGSAFFVLLDRTEIRPLTFRPSQVHGSRSSSSQQCAHSSNPRLLLCRQGEVSAHPACLARCVRSGRTGD